MTRSLPSREEWAKQHRTFYDTDQIKVSEKAADYTSPEELAAAIAEARALWSEMGRLMKAAGPAMSEAEWRRRFLACQSREERDQLYNLPEYARLELSRERSGLNRKIVKPLIAGWVPHDGFRTSSGGISMISLCHGGDYTEKLPKTAEIYRRRCAAHDAAIEATQAEYAARPVDDTAWEQELERRAKVQAWLAGDRFYGRP